MPTIEETAPVEDDRRLLDEDEELRAYYEEQEVASCYHMWLDSLDRDRGDPFADSEYVRWGEHFASHAIDV